MLYSLFDANTGQTCSIFAETPYVEEMYSGVCIAPAPEQGS